MEFKSATLYDLFGKNRNFYQYITNLRCLQILGEKDFVEEFDGKLKVVEDLLLERNKKGEKRFDCKNDADITILRKNLFIQKEFINFIRSLIRFGTIAGESEGDLSIGLKPWLLDSKDNFGNPNLLDDQDTKEEFVDTLRILRDRINLLPAFSENNFDEVQNLDLRYIEVPALHVNDKKEVTALKVKGENILDRYEVIHTDKIKFAEYYLLNAKEKDHLSYIFCMDPFPITLNIKGLEHTAIPAVLSYESGEIIINIREKLERYKFDGLEVTPHGL